MVIAYFPGLQPTALNGGKSFVPEGQRDVGDVLDAWSDVRVTLAVYCQREFLQDMQDDRDVVRGKVPGHVDILLKEPQVEAARIDVPDLADVSGLDNLGDFTDGSRIKECVANHQHQPLAFSDFDKFFALRRRGGHRFLDQRMFTGKQGGLGQWKVVLDRRGDDNCIQPHAIEQMSKVSHALYIRIQAPHVLQSRFAEIAHRSEIAIGQRFEVPNEIGAPISTSDHAYDDLFLHKCYSEFRSRFFLSTARPVVSIARPSISPNYALSQLRRELQEAARRWPALFSG